MTEKTEAARQAEEREAKAAWMNEQIAERLPQADDEQPGTAPAKDARTGYTAPVEQPVKPTAKPKTADTP